MEKKTTKTTVTKATKTTATKASAGKAKKAIDPKNKPTLPAKKPEAVTTKQDTEKNLNAPATFSESDVARYDSLVSSLKDSWGAVQKATMKTAFVLFEVYNSGLYRIDGYKNIYEFGLDMFGQSKSTVNRLINIVDRFGKQIANGKPVEEIDSKYSGYSQSQLEVMLGHTDDELKLIKPEMSVREIKKALKEDKPTEEKAKESATDAKASGSDETDAAEPIKTEKGLLIWEFSKPEEWDTILDSKDQTEYQLMLSAIRKCLAKGHKVRILDVFEVVE